MIGMMESAIVLWFLVGVTIGLGLLFIGPIIELVGAI
ncbi:hypothetical protein SAMN05443661_102210 [Natronobacterium gregoryi]|uniref:Uncharacterized protein n=2 Tax=Natronobacterium gregoryi TaxID=44930 RepID=L0AGW4_NATGS|nr:hypothetical protein Natgr_1871 [Natronobacterium gregoryi SP2]SFI62441.1 hypothetical protein SAMN05443661_102210 [Natronobacterium gregoryi]